MKNRILNRMRKDANVKKHKKIALSLNDLIIKDEDDEELDYTDDARKVYESCHENVDELKQQIENVIKSINDLKESGFLEAASKDSFEEFISSLNSLKDISLDGKFQTCLNDLGYTSNQLAGIVTLFDDDYSSIFMDY